MFSLHLGKSGVNQIHLFFKSLFHSYSFKTFTFNIKWVSYLAIQYFHHFKVCILLFTLPGQSIKRQYSKETNWSSMSNGVMYIGWQFQAGHYEDTWHCWKSKRCCYLPWAAHLMYQTFLFGVSLNCYMLQDKNSRSIIPNKQLAGGNSWMKAFVCSVQLIFLALP